ncbi:hypothetical protein JCM7447_15700 [Corynebacterium amycolatum]
MNSTEKGILPALGIESAWRIVTWRPGDSGIVEDIVTHTKRCPILESALPVIDERLT